MASLQSATDQDSATSFFLISLEEETALNGLSLSTSHSQHMCHKGDKWSILAPWNLFSSTSFVLGTAVEYSKGLFIVKQSGEYLLSVVFTLKEKSMSKR